MAVLYVTYAVGNFEGKAGDVDKEQLARLPCTVQYGDAVGFI